MNHSPQKTTLSLFSFFLFLVSFLSCEKTTAPVNKLQLTLTADYVGVTETDLLLQTKNTEANTQYQLFRDDSLLSDGALIQAETIITDTLLLPAHHYSYQAFLIKDQKRIAQSEARQVTTLDTTSHDFQWEVIEFPSLYGSGVLRDVAIINENDIWAVGEIYSDSAQPWLPYNVVHWDGKKWELLRVYFPTVCGQSSLTPYPAKAVFAFEDGRIWISSSGDKIAILKDNNQINNFCLPSSVSMSTNKIWGKSSNDLYVVGSEGLIAHYNNSSWQKLENPVTDLPIQDIWGAIDPRTGKELILCVASDKYHNLGRKVLKIEDHTISSVNDSGLTWSLSSVWFMPGKRYYIAGAGIYPKNKIDSPEPWIRYPSGTVTSYFTNRIRGNDINDVIAAGAFGEMVHYNGITWHNYYSETQLNSGNYYSVAIKNNLVVAVGSENGHGVLTIGVRH